MNASKESSESINATQESSKSMNATRRSSKSKNATNTSSEPLRPLKVARFIVLIALASVTMWQIQENAARYLKYEAVTSLSKEVADTINFPQVTICNFNRLKKSMLTPDDVATVYRAYDIAAGKNSSNASRPGVPLDLYNFTYERGWRLTDYANTEVLNLNSSQTLLLCVYSGRPCNTRFFRHRMTSYGNCYTFNQNLTESDIASTGDSKLTLPLMQTHASESGGLTLYIDVEAYDYSESMMIDGNPLIGLKVLIHSEYEEPDPTGSGFSVSPGFYATMAVKKTEYYAIPPPFGKCDTKKRLKQFHRYSKTACERECKIDIVDQNCSCRPYFFPKASVMCDIDSTLACVTPTLETIDSHFSQYCHCPAPCYYEEYTPVVSYANFPSVIMGKDLVSVLGLTSVDQIKNNVVGLKIYFADIGSTIVTQSPSYTFTSILNDLGATLGLYLGFSIFTFFELLENVVDLVRNHNAKKKIVLSPTPDPSSGSSQ